MRQLVPWFGSDANSAREIVAQFGPHKAYVEPFCGGLSVLAAKPKVTRERAYDLHGGLINLARVVSYAVSFTEFLDHLDWVIYADGVLNDAQARLNAGVYQGVEPSGEPSVQWAVDFYVVCWMGLCGFAGTSGDSKMPTRWNTGGGWGGSRFRSAIDGLTEFRQRMIGVEFRRECGIEAVEKMKDEDGTLIFADPPFIDEGTAYEHPFRRRQGSGLFDDETPDDHERLAEALNAKRLTRVVLEYHDHPDLEELYPRDRWNRVQLGARDQASNGSGTKSEKASILLTNGPILVDPSARQRPETRAARGSAQPVNTVSTRQHAIPSATNLRSQRKTPAECHH